MESVWVLLQVHTTFPSVISKSFVKEAFKRKKFIDDELARTVADLVMVRYDIKAPPFTKLNSRKKRL